MNVVYLADDRVLLLTPPGRSLIEEIGGYPAVEFVQVHSFDSGLQALVIGPQALHHPFPNGLLGAVRFDHRFLKPFEDWWRDDQLLENAHELAGKHFLARVRLGTFSPVPSAVVVDIAALLDLSNEHAPAMSALNQPAKRELVLHLSGFGFSTLVQQFLDTFPTVTSHQGFVAALIGDTIPIELALVQAIAQDLMRKALPDPPSAKRHAFAAKLCD